MAQAKITLIGVENYLNPERSVFDSMILPEGIDKNVLIGSIILRCQEFELLYSDPDFLIPAVGVWSRKNYRTFDKWVKALDVEYDPLYNYDRTEEYTDTHTGSSNRTGSFNSTGSGSNTLTNNLTDTTADTLTHSEKAYNDTNYVGTTQDQSNGSIARTGTASNALSNSNQGSDSDQSSDSYTNVHKARLFGNIGVTTSQQMLQSELDIARWNLYEHIADLFCNEFCIMVY